MFPIPTVMTAQELLDFSLARAAKAKGKGRNQVERGRSAAVAKVQTLGDSLDTKFKSYVEAIPSLDGLSDFHRELVDVVVGTGDLKHNLGALDWCREQVLKVCRRSARDGGRAESPAEALRIRKAAYGRVASLVKQVGPNLTALAAARKKLLEIPDIDPETPTIVVAGYPNVGKSQFVRAVSTGKPKIAPYPFTTQGINVGHVERGWRRYLIVDTPGLLDRPMEERNHAERQAIVALRHLADVIVFLFDPTETCGFPMAVQERLLAEVREAFPDILLVEVENKADLSRSASGRQHISALTGDGCTAVIDGAISELRRPTSRDPAAAPPPEAH